MIERGQHAKRWVPKKAWQFLLVNQSLTRTTEKQIQKLGKRYEGLNEKSRAGRTIMQKGPERGRRPLRYDEGPFCFTTTYLFHSRDDMLQRSTQPVVLSFQSWAYAFTIELLGKKYLELNLGT